MSRERLCLPYVAGSCIAGLFAMSLIVGCGKSAPPDTTANANSPDLGSGTTQFEPAQPFVPRNSQLPTASISSPDTTGEVDSTVIGPGKGTPEWLIQEITRLRVQEAPQTDDPERLGHHRRWKNERIIEYAQEAITLTHTDSAKEPVFHTAVKHLMEARLELAVQESAVQSDSERRHVEELYADAESLYERDPKSRSAADAAFVRARFANLSAERFAAEEPRWLEELSRQARLFASSFPQETERSVQLLDAAGRSCELHRLREEAIKCYTILAGEHAASPQGKQATAALRRLGLDGEKLESFAGPTLDGGFTRIDDYRGRIVIVAFWASHFRKCVEELPRLQALTEKWGNSRTAILGVNLDTEKAAAEQFVQHNKSLQTSIFWPEKNRRSWNNPIVQYYGVRDIPMYWLIDKDGHVVNTLLDLNGIEREVGKLLSTN